MNLKYRVLAMAVIALTAVAGSIYSTSALMHASQRHESAEQLLKAQQAHWESILQLQFQQMHNAMRSVTRNRPGLQGLEQGDASRLREHFMPSYRRLQASGVANRLSISNAQGYVIFSAPADSHELERSTLAALAIEQGRFLSGVERNARGKLIALAAMPIYSQRGALIGAGILVRDLALILDEFINQSAARLSIIDPLGRTEYSTGPQPHAQLNLDLPPLNHTRIWHRQTQESVYQFIVWPLRDYTGVPIARLVKAHDQTQRWRAYERMQNISLLANVLTILLVLGLIYWYLSRTFNRDLRQLSDTNELLERHISARTQELSASKEKLEKEIQERHLAENIIRRQAFHDNLTDLPNRVQLTRHLEEALNQLNDPQRLTLLLFNLDNFREINDTLGHNNGDRIIQGAALRLRALAKEAYTIARMSNDEFAIVYTGLEGESEITRVAEHLLREMEQPYLMNGLVLNVQSSIGIAIAPNHGDNADLLLRRADVALHHSKQHRSGFAIYQSQYDQFNPQRLSLMGELRNAILQNELELYFQPQIRLIDYQLVGFEALIRWNHPTHGLMPPDTFIPLAEQSGLIRPLTQWVLNAALQHSKAWQTEGVSVPISVNLSPRNLHDANISERISQLLEGWSVAAEHLVLELTENAIIADTTKASTTLNTLNQMGCQLSIDDFGTGYSSLAYLKHLPVDELKIDKSFVLDMLSDESDRVIVESTIKLAHNLGLRVIAEGVENDKTLSMLQELECDTVQGYLISRPLPWEQIRQWLENEYPMLWRQPRHEAAFDTKLTKH